MRLFLLLTCSCAVFLSSVRVNAEESQQLKEVRQHVVDVTYRTNHLRNAVKSLQLAGFDAEAKLLSESLHEMEKLETKLQLQEALLQVEQLREERKNLLTSREALARENEALKKEFAELTLKKVMFHTRVIEVKAKHEEEIIAAVAKFIRETEDFPTSPGMFGSTRGTELLSYLDECQKEGKIKTISQPSLVTKVGHEAKIVIGGNAPVIDPTGKHPGVMLQPIGLRMEYLPQAAKENELELNFHVEFNEPVMSDQQVNGVNVATIERREMSTSVKYNPNEHILVSGLPNNKPGKPIMLVITETEYVEPLEATGCKRTNIEPPFPQPVYPSTPPAWKPAESKVKRANYVLPSPATTPEHPQSPTTEPEAWQGFQFDRW